MSTFALPSEVASALTTLIGSDEPFIISIDGPAGSGKTTLAGLIADELTSLGATSLIIHMDDLYNGWDDALTDSLGAKLKEVTASHLAQSGISHRKYDWYQGEYGPILREEPSTALILEGVGSGDRAIGGVISLLIWIETSMEIGLERVLLRDPDIEPSMMHTWQNREREYFAANEIKVAAKIQLST